MSTSLLIMRLLLAATFGVAGLAKLADREGTRQAILDFGLPANLGAPLGLLMPLAEIAVALVLLPASTAWWGALAAVILLLLFIAAISFNLVRGRQPDCHCFGQLHSAPVGRRTLLRNGVLAALAGVVVWQGPAHVGTDAVSWLAVLSSGQAVQIARGVFVLGLPALEAWVLVNLLQQNGRLLMRVEALEARLVNGTDKPESAMPARDRPRSVLVGERAPALKLPDLTGKAIDLADFQGSPTLVLFWNPACGYCRRMLPDLKAWEAKSSKSVPRLLVVSSGTLEANVAMGLQSPIVLDQGFAVAQAFGADGTPAGMLIDAQGHVAAELAVGAPAVLALAGRQNAAQPAIT